MAIGIESKPLPYTVQRLLAIRPGERVVYYRGKLPDDLIRTQSNNLTPAAAEVIAAVVGNAVAQERAGICVLDEESIEIPIIDPKDGKECSSFRCKAYVAIGCSNL